MSTDEAVLAILGKTRAELKTDLNGGYCGRHCPNPEEAGEYWMDVEQGN